MKFYGAHVIACPTWQVASRLSDLSREELEDLLIKAEAERKAAVNKRKRLHFLFVVVSLWLCLVANAVGV